MAKKSAVAKQKRREQMVARRWEQRQKLKRIIKDENSTEQERAEAVDTLNKLPRDSCYIRLRNRCALTGRPRGYHRKYGVSRIVLREFASRGVIPGMVKASW